MRDTYDKISVPECEEGTYGHLLEVCLMGDPKTLGVCYPSKKTLFGYE